MLKRKRVWKQWNTGELFPSFTHLFVDEAHEKINHGTMTGKCIRRFAFYEDDSAVVRTRQKFVVLITGTPIQLRVKEIEHYLPLLNLEDWGGFRLAKKSDRVPVKMKDRLLRDYILYRTE